MNTDQWGIDGKYVDAGGEIRTVSSQAIDRIRQTMGKPPDPEAFFYDAPVRVVRQGMRITLPEPADLRLEDGSVVVVTDHLPDTVPIGYHDLIAASGHHSPVRLIVTPGRCHLPVGLRTWGWNAQVYAARSRTSWGIGDLADLRRLARWSQDLGAGMVLVNPLDAPLPVVPQEASPYSPSSRRFLNPMYLRVEDMPGAAFLGKDLQRLVTAGHALNQDRHIDRDQVFKLKQQAFQLLWSRFTGNPEFDAFRAEGGRTLNEFAVFCVLTENHGTNWRRWPAAFRNPASEEVLRFAKTHQDRVRFHEWLQWQLHDQLLAASRYIPLMHDLPIGFSSDGADAWVWQDLIAQGMTVGAPPDLYNTEGQDWGLPPFVPHKLRKAAYKPFIQTIRSALRFGGGLRIDHVMGLFRLWWVPDSAKASEGAYVRYPVDELLAILEVESERAKAVIVGEDLGTVEPGVREKLSGHNVLSYRVFWFEEEAPSSYPEKALAAVTTHDLPTLAGVWTGADFTTQQSLGLNPDQHASERFRDKLLQTTGLEADADVTQAITKTIEQLADAPSAIVMAMMEAVCVVSERPNMPSAAGKYPNWSLALPLPLEDIEASEHPRRLAGILNLRKVKPPSAS
ncbi:4-alpha-glucanotransferase [Nitrospira sp. KM1]|uniref:4-alpha-glucanotransferase n=1 Tax=Nitrospira sp. KM1 TaxID=1936990 RepID=UPI0013A72EF6|nr:4-alpha-glucanotransferase [Nitrospira sp. KM1]BCA55603.1 4-alpha-glucanotransferase [Nitrospira sp. KM1]